MYGTRLHRMFAALPLGWVGEPPPLVPVVRLNGVIGQMGPLRGGITLQAVAPALKRAFDVPNLAAVALAINSPGGSAVQSALIAGRIRALANEKGVPVHAFVEDVAASGGYWLACAADEIHAMPASIVGSIGVITAGFGLTDLLARYGIERRVYTAGERKGMLDPFQPENPDHVKRLKALQAEIHDDFKAFVRDRRGTKLVGNEKDLFSGEFWGGRRGLELGLIDGIGDLRSVMRETFGEKVKLPIIESPRSWWQRRIPFGGGNSNIGAAWGAGLLAAAEERLLWNRYGL
ncbi:MAG: S49 family peptidase [Rhodospirillales bacterium]|nr:S49 family peptidase [Rhodospirillales bacterium]MCW8862376.1 S49 family peptidase [Rhodospirillales bacterium]MCW8951819.1 S49 family peptidase [Rhodospirillales bacterium]MCW9001393.1 S49 family peptidase [Rhodospirillales bacterium]